MKEWLEGIGIENPSNDQISSSMALYNQAKEDGSKDINVEEIKANYKKELETEFTEKFKGYISAEEHNKVVDELNGLKSANAKADRFKMYKSYGAAEDDDVLELLDSKFNGENGTEENIKAYLNEHKHFMGTPKEPNPNPAPNPNPQPQPIKIGELGGGGKPNPAEDTLRGALAEAMGIK